MLDPLLLNIDFLPTIGSTQRLGQADDLADCGGAAGWYFDDPLLPTQILLCPTSCTDLELDPGAELELLEGCHSILN